MKDIKYVDYGLANCYCDRIELHKDLLLPRYTDLHNRLLQHEQKHTNQPFSWKDIWLDMHAEPGVLLFMLCRASTWCDFSPVWKRGRDWIIDWNLVMFYGFTAVLAGLFTVFTRRYM